MTSIEAQDFCLYNQYVAEIMVTRDHDRVPELLVKACRALVPAHSGLIVIFGEASKPRWIYDDVPADVHSQHIDTYFQGAYLLDPFYRAGVSNIDSGVYSLADVSPPGFSSSEYHRRYYKESRIRDEVGFITQLPDGCFANLSLVVVDDSPRFSRAQIDCLKQAQPLVDTVLTDYWGARAPDSVEESPDLHSQLEYALAVFGDSVLTSREAEVIRLYLQGHSTRSIAEKLDISPHTVSLHRKNSYAKLDVSSQSELFHMFIDSLVCFDRELRDDPLKRYLGVA